MRIYTSQKTNEILETISRHLGYEFRILARIGVALSIKINWINEIENIEDTNWKEFRDETIFQDYELFYKSLFSSIYNKQLSDIEFMNRFKYHLDKWALLLDNKFKEADYNEHEFLYKITEYVWKSESYESSWQNSWDIYKLDISLGKDMRNWEEIIMRLNNKKEHWNSHLAIMWKPWTGKTQILLNILAQIREKSNFKTNFIFFDYKHDSGIHWNDTNFLQKTKADVYTLPYMKLPINPFILSDYNDKTIKMSANEKAESFSSIGRWFGIVQKWNLQDAILECYEDRKELENKFPDFNELFEKITKKYEDSNLQKDSLIETLRNLSDFELFWDHKTWWELIDKIYNETFILDLSKLNTLKELAAYLVIEKLYKEMVQLDDSKLEGDYREIRTILVIDEAHNYLSQKNIFLNKIIREWRSKWIVVFFGSQSPKDYEQDDFNFKELLEFALILNCDNLTPSSVQKLISCTPNSAKELQQEIPKLEPGELVIKEKNEKWYLKIKWNMYWENFIKE